MKDSATSKALKRLTRTKLGKDHILEFQIAILKDTDRSVAISLGSIVEDGLKAALMRRMPQLTQEETLFGPDAPLGNFSAKIRLAHALGILGPGPRNDIDRIREVRNAFAHTMVPLSFDTKEVNDVCKLLAPNGLPPEMQGRHRFTFACLEYHDLLMYPEGPRGKFWSEKA